MIRRPAAFFKLMFPVVATLTLVGCVANKLPSGSVSASHTIAIVSGLGSEIHFARSGITVFGNVKSVDPVPDWKIDDLIIAQMTKSLGTDRKIIARIVTPQEYYGFEPDPNFADLWVVVGPTCANGGNYSGPLPCGVSISRPEKIFGEPKAWLEIQAMVSVFDGRTKKEIARSTVALPTAGDCPPFSAKDGDACAPGRNLGPDYAVDSWADFNPTQVNFIHKQVLEILAPSIEYTLREMNLI